jgi:hypothetical protein
MAYLLANMAQSTHFDGDPDPHKIKPGWGRDPDPHHCKKFNADPRQSEIRMKVMWICNNAFP